MTSEKRRKLIAKGWRVGTAEEFLGLTDPEAAYIDLRMRLADALRAARGARGLTQAQLAEHLGSSQSRVAKMEAGDPTVSLDLLVRGLLAMGFAARELAGAITGTGPLRSARRRRAAMA